MNHKVEGNEWITRDSRKTPHTSWRSSPLAAPSLNYCQLGLNFNLSLLGRPKLLRRENDEMPSHLRNWRFSYFAPSPFLLVIEGWTIAIVAKNSHPKGTTTKRCFVIHNYFFFKRIHFYETTPHDIHCLFPSHPILEDNQADKGSKKS